MSTKNRLWHIVLSGLCLMSFNSAVTATELIKNGSFENYTITQDKGKWKLVNFDDWVGDGEVWTAKLGKTATDGVHKIELDVGTERNELSQTVSTVVATQYRLSLDAYARRNKSSDFEILVDGVVLATITPDRKWAEYSVYFIGTGADQLITLRELATQNDSYGSIIDNVSLQTSNELLKNGSFEHFSTNKDNGRWKLVTFSDWEGAGEAWTNKLGKRATQGAYKLELDVGQELNSLSQIVTTENGLEYQLSLDAYARNKKSSDFEVWVDDTKLETITPDRKQWNRYSFIFIGKGTAQKIQFKEIESQNNSHGTLIDNVSLISTGNRANSAPTISGTPLDQINSDETYTFTPSSYDAESDTLSFSIENKPMWASFDTTTGILTGIPSETDVGTTSDILISVQDASLSANLALFSIEVLKTIKPIANVNAVPFSVASQAPRNGYYYYSSPDKAIDGDSSTFNHTQCNATENWWQLALPSPTVVASIMIQGRASQTGRLSNASVYLTQTPYTGTLDAANQIATLAGTADQQETVLDTPLSANYLIVKASGNNCLHLANVEVAGQVPQAPSFNAYTNEYLIAGNTASATVVASITANDLQNDTLSYRIIGDVPFSIDAQGNISVTETLAAQAYRFDVEVSDGTNTISTTLTINATSNSAVEDALNSGDASAVTATELLVQAREEIASLRAGNTLLNDLYNSEAIAYDAGNRSQVINIKGDLKQIFPILYGNKGKVLAAAGTKENSRFAAFGAAPMEHFQAGNNLAYQAQFKRLLAWLITGQATDSASLSTNRTIALSFANSDRNDIKNWLAANYANWTIKACDDAASLATCYSGVDLIITGWQTDSSHASSVRQTLESVVSTGTAVLYLHTWYEAYNEVAHTIADLFGFALPYGGNYWVKDAANWDNVAAMQAATFSGLGYEPIDQVLAHFQNNDYSLDWSGCDNSGRGASCPYSDAFGTAGSRLRSMMTALDASKTTLFPNERYRLQKLLILLGDKYRQEVVYPMDKVSSDDNAFFKSLYADTTVYNYRSINPAQKDMGNFSRSDFSHITPHSKTVNLTSKKNFRSTGVYALPGQTFQVIRTDNSAVKTKVFINTLRSGATHEFERNGYKRPKYLKTVAFEIASGETLQLTSPYGGTVQISFDTNDLPVAFNFTHIGEHPYWASSADDSSFTQKLDAGDFDWAEVVTSGFEVHSKLEKMRASVADPKWGTAQALANATEHYMSNFPHVLAGFKGPGIDIVPEIHDFAASKNLTVHNLDLVKHMNADQATCGSGCSGNPYDAYWSYSPIGHGDVHELGHGLEKSRFRFEGWEGHSTTNPYSYYTKSKYNETTGGDPSCQSLPFKQVFDTLQASVADSNPVTYMQNNLWASSGWSQQFMVTLQAMMQAQNLGQLDNGWHLLARLHLLEREVNTVKANWETKKTLIGFDQYSLDEFNAMRKNDWMLVSLSFAAGLDYRDYLTMMGMEYSQQAADQVASFAYPMVPKTFFVSTPNGYCKTDAYGSFLNKSSVAIDGSSIYPE